MHRRFTLKSIFVVLPTIALLACFGSTAFAGGSGEDEEVGQPVVASNDGYSPEGISVKPCANKMTFCHGHDVAIPVTVQNQENTEGQKVLLSFGLHRPGNKKGAPVTWQSCKGRTGHTVVMEWDGRLDGGKKRPSGKFDVNIYARTKQADGATQELRKQNKQNWAKATMTLNIVDDEQK